MNYKVGMKIRIVDEYDYNDPMGIGGYMEDLRGKVATIVDTGVNRHGRYYKIDIDDGDYIWSDTMIKPLALNKGKPEEKIVETVDVKKIILPGSYYGIPVGSTGTRFLSEFVCRWSTN